MQEGWLPFSTVQHPTISLAGDVAATKLIIHAQEGPELLVGPSYEGAVITEAATDPQIVELVYLCAFAPDMGESVNTLIVNFPAGGPLPPIQPPQEGFLFVERANPGRKTTALPGLARALVARERFPGQEVSDPSSHLLTQHLLRVSILNKCFIQSRQTQAVRVALPEQRSCSVSCAGQTLDAVVRAATQPRKAATGLVEGCESASPDGEDWSPP